MLVGPQVTNEGFSVRSGLCNLEARVRLRLYCTGAFLRVYGLPYLDVLDTGDAKRKRFAQKSLEQRSLL